MHARRTLVLYLLIVSLLMTVVPASSSALGRNQSRGVTIATTPREGSAGDAVLVYGRVTSGQAGVRLLLYTAISPVKVHHIQVIGTITSGPGGYYERLLPAGAVTTNRELWVRIAAHAADRSRILKQHTEFGVAASAVPGSAQTGKPVVISGRVFPSAARRTPVILQAQTAPNGGRWTDVAAGTVGARSRYSVAVTFHSPTVKTLRIWVPHTGTNTDGYSEPVSLVVREPDVSGFSIATSPLGSAPGAEAITGVLDVPGTTTPAATGTAVELWGRALKGRFTALARATTGPSGAYSFSARPGTNSVYQVRTVSSPLRRSAEVAVAVTDQVTLSKTRRNLKLGQTLALRGRTSAPPGRTVQLQRLTRAGWVTVVTVHVSAGSRFVLRWSADVLGSVELRALVPGGTNDAGGASQPAAVTVASPASPHSLPAPA
jgi:hypothetical protein